MQRSAITLLAAIAIMGSARANDLERLKGTWRAVSIVDGPNEIKGSSEELIIDKDHFSWTTRTVIQGTIQLDPGREHGVYQRDETGPVGPHRERGIYRLEGDDYSECWNYVDGTLPTVLESRRGSKFALWKWHRVAKAERGITGGVADLDGTWKLTSWTVSGWATPDWAIRTFTINFDAGRYTREVLSERKGTLRLHPSASPPQVDLLRDSPASKGIMDLSKGTSDYFGIYRLEDDTLTLDLGIDRERPKEFGPHRNTFMHRVFKRAGGAWRGA